MSEQELLEKIVIPEGEDPISFVSKIRAISLKVNPDDLTPNRRKELFIDAVQRNLVEGFVPVKISKEEQLRLEREMALKAEALVLKNKIRKWIKRDRSNIPQGTLSI